MTSQNIFSIGLSTDEGGLIVEALAERPFKEVFELIGKLHRQASASGCGDDGRAANHHFTFAAHELALTLKALGALPFNRVDALVRNLNSQMQRQSGQHTLNKASAPHVER